MATDKPLSPGARFRRALAEEKPLAIPGAYSPCSALIVRDAGFRAMYLSGSGVAAAFGLPDLGMTTMTEVVGEARRLTAVAPEVPLLVDVDTGFGSELMIERTVRELIHAGVAAIHIEDQEAVKRCGHRPNKKIVGADEMAARIAAAHATRKSVDPDFFIMARTDAFAQEGIEGTIDRAKAYIAAGADAIFAEALTSLEDFRTVCAALPVPVLANMTEFGKTPYMTVQQFGSVGVGMVLFPLSIFRLTLGAARKGARILREQETQEPFVGEMMSRSDFYELIDYHAYEKRADAL